MAYHGGPEGDGMDYTRISADCHIDMQFGHLPAATVRKIVCENAGKFYGLIK
jgi:hypothetical protein